MKAVISVSEILLLIGICLFATALTTHVSVNSSTKPWDYLVFAQQWSETSCIDEDIFKHGEHNCQVPSEVHTWAIHGIWPSRTGAKDEPVDCNKTWTFDESKLQPIKESLLEYWPNCYKDTSPDSFWAHEWSKHGTCATSSPEMSNELAYFSQGLKLAQKYNLTSWMNAAGITPSNTTQLKLQTFVDVIVKNTNYEPLMQCAWSHKSQVQFIGQVYICLDRKEFKPIQCPRENSEQIVRMKGWRKASSFEPCDHNKTVIYPQIYHSPSSKPVVQVI